MQSSPIALKRQQQSVLECVSCEKDLVRELVDTDDVAGELKISSATWLSTGSSLRSKTKLDHRQH